MSEHEFEAYLNLLARTLRLSEAQRARISGELRDHLEARMTELIEEEHLSKEDAVLAALDEFGDANVLAHDLTGPATQLKRKHIMQTGFGVIATAAVVAVAATFLTPTNFQGHPTQTVATAAGEADTAPSAASTAPNDVLDRPLTVSYTGTPLKVVLEDLASQSGLNMFVDWIALDHAGVATHDSDVTLTFDEVSLRTVLDLILHQTTSGYGRYGFKDSVLVITATDGEHRPILETPLAKTETAIYDCSDLLNPALMLSESNANYLEPAKQLQSVIELSLGESAWTEDTSISQFGTLLVVRQTEAAHEKVASILNKLETATAEIAEATAEIAEQVEYEQGVARQQRLEAEKADIMLRNEMEALEMKIALQTNMILSNDRQLANAEAEEKERLLATNSIIETRVSEAKTQMERMKLKLVR